TAKVTTKHAFKGLLEPLNHLLATAKAIKQRRDFSLRLSVASSGELGDLISGFNELIDEVGNRDAALQKDRLQMEQRVRERTSALNDDVASRDAEVSQLKQNAAESEERIKELEDQVASLRDSLEKKAREVPATRTKTVFLYDLDSTSSK